MLVQDAIRVGDRKATINVVKHGLPFDEAVAVFADHRRVDTDCSRLADGEVRRKVIGMIDDQLFTIMYTLREDRVRLISARRPNPKEIRAYGHR